MMTTTNRHHHLRGLLPSKPPPWRHRHRPRHRVYLLPSLTHLLSFRTVHRAHTTPINTTPPVNTTPMSCSHFLPVLSQIEANNHLIKSTPFNYPLSSFHPTIPRSLHAETTFYLPQLPPPTAPIVIPIADQNSHTHPITNSYVTLLQKESFTYISILAHHALSMRTLPTTHVPSTSLTTPTRPQNLTKTNTFHVPSTSATPNTSHVEAPQTRLTKNIFLCAHTNHRHPHPTQNHFCTLFFCTTTLPPSSPHIMTDPPPTLAALFTTLLGTADASSHETITATSHTHND